jgi:hypothetical protein
MQCDKLIRICDVKNFDLIKDAENFGFVSCVKRINFNLLYCKFSGNELHNK